MKKRTLPLLIVFIGIIQISSLLYSNENTYRFLSLTPKQGLSHINIECIFKDSDGFVWFGTRNGLCRYDGYNITVFHSSNDSLSLSGDRILSINEDKDGVIWIGTYGNGLNKFDKKTEKFSNYKNNNAISGRINRIKAFKDGSLWVCMSHGLAKYIPETDSFKIFLHDDKTAQTLNDNCVYDITQTKNGNIFVATESNYIQQFNPETEIFNEIIYKRVSELPGNYRKRIVEDNDGNLWIAANGHGLCFLNTETKESTIYLKQKNQLTSNTLSGDMAVDNENNLWVCTDGGGINILNIATGKFTYLQNDENNLGSISSNHIYTVYFDNVNTVWVGTFDKGVNYYDPARFKFSSYLFKPGDLDSFSNKSIKTIFQDKKGRVWIGTDGQGLFMFDSKGILHSYYYQSNNKNSLSTNVITCINEDNSGNTLIGTYSGGLISFNPEKNKFFRFDDVGNSAQQIGSINIWNILVDSKKRVWLGLLGTGLDLFDPETKTFSHYGPYSSRNDKIDYQNVMAVMEDSDGDIWIGTEGKGIYVFDKETQKIIRLCSEEQNSFLTKGVIKSLFQDRHGFIWIGTEGDGLYKYNKANKEIVHFSSEDGVESNIIQSILEDNQNNIWLGTANGLTVFDQNANKFRHYIEADGLSGNEYNQGVLVQLKDGRFIAGTTSGIDVFRPDKIKMNQNLPRVILTKLNVLNQEIKPFQKINNKVILHKSITYTDNIIISYKEKSISFEFAALNYTLPEKCEYKYKLEGFDEHWNITTSDRREASYSNLDAGNYIFKVKASNNDGKWGNNERILNIKVLPPFYKTWWFRTLSGLILLSVFYLVYLYRLNIVKSRFRQKQIIQERKIMILEKEKIEAELQKLTFHVLNRNRTLIEQKNRLIGLSMKAREVVSTGLQDIITKIDEELTDDKDWVYIEPQLDKAYNNFVSRLKEKHSDLTLSEIKIAAYVRMNHSTKEISEFMHKTIRAVENDRYRLRKKIGLDSNDSLQNYLMNL